MNSLLEFEHLEDHQACPAGAAKGLSMEGLMKEVGCRHVDPICVVKYSLEHGPATSSSPSTAN